MKRPRPGARAPELRVNVLDETDIWSLSEHKPPNFTLLVFYRGLHCPKCQRYLGRLEELQPELRALGVEPLAISMDTESKARQARERWSLSELRLGYGLGEATAREWGLYLSSALSDEEPEIFNEPGLFLVEPDHTVYMVAINSAPYGRPQLDELLSAVQYAIANNRPPRGTYEMVPEPRSAPPRYAMEPPR